MANSESGGATLRRLWEEDCLLLPGVYDPIGALLAKDAGARALYLSGAGVANGAFGLPDIGLIDRGEMAEQARRVVRAAGLPVLSDADTGYGEPLGVARTVRLFEEAGLAGLHLEDQRNPKRCGHLEGKELVPPSEMAAKIRAATEARTDRAFVIVARTDARGPEGLQAAIVRALSYVDSGADAVFPEGLQSEQEFEEFRRRVPGPLVANMTEFGVTPLIPFRRFRELGYQAVIYPLTAFRVMLRCVGEAYRTLLREGTQAPLVDGMAGRQELYRLLGYDQAVREDARWAEQARKADIC
ncbi:MAG: isocitrate lyase/phosphoenolpyruvate mutase family protein [Fimbriimonadales bacterium]